MYAGSAYSIAWDSPYRHPKLPSQHPGRIDPVLLKSGLDRDSTYVRIVEKRPPAEADQDRLCKPAPADNIVWDGLNCNSRVPFVVFRCSCTSVL